MEIGKKLRGFQIGKETVQGTTVAATKLLKSVTITPPKRMPNIGKVEAEGHRNAVATTRGKRWSTFGLSGNLDYNVMHYIGAGMFQDATPTNPGTGAYQYAFSDLQPDLPTLHTPVTYTFEYGNSLGSNGRFSFGCLTDFTFRIAENGCTWDASGFGQYPSKNITMTATPTLVHAKAVNFGDCRLSFATTYAGIAAGKLYKGKSVEFSMKGRFKAVFFIDDATQSFGGILELKPDCTGKVIVGEGSESDALLASMDSSQQVWFESLCTGPLIVAGTPNIYNLLRYRWSAFINNEEDTDVDDLFAGSYDFYAGEDNTNGDLAFTVINTQATL